MNSVRLTVIVCAVLAVSQTIYLLLPANPEALRMFDMAVRPTVYGLLAAAVFVFTRFARPASKSFNANIGAIITVSIFAAAYLLAAVLIGSGRNAYAASFPVVIRSLWNIGLIVVLGEFIRYKLLKTINHNYIAPALIGITIVLAYGHMNAVRVMIASQSFSTEIFFESIFMPLVVSAVASYFAIKGNFLSVILVSFSFIMAVRLVPFVPNIPSLVYALMISVIAFLGAIIHRIFLDDGGRFARKREKRVAKYAEKTMSYYVYNAATVAVIFVLILFFTGAFRYYPIAIRTDSMTGVFNRGSLVFVERIDPDDVFIRAENGVVVHFRNRYGAEFIHRIVGYSVDAEGERLYITKGDANEEPDNFHVPQENVIGVAHSTIPVLGYPYLFFTAIRNSF
jgi:signal peptidase